MPDICGSQKFSRCRRHASRSIWRHSARGSTSTLMRARSSQPVRRPISCGGLSSARRLRADRRPRRSRAACRATRTPACARRARGRSPRSRSRASRRAARSKSYAYSSPSDSSSRSRSLGRMPRTGKREKIARPFAAAMRSYAPSSTGNASMRSGSPSASIDRPPAWASFLSSSSSSSSSSRSRGLCSGAGFGDERVRRASRAASRDTAATLRGSSARTAARRRPGGSRASR